MATVSASTPGSSGNPLVTRDYLHNTYANRLYIDIREQFDTAANNALSSLEDMYRMGYSFAPHFTDITLRADETIMLTMGSSFILQSGSATLSFTSGTVINITTGNAVQTDTALARRQRYFCTENTSALITASSTSVGQVDGYYKTDGAIQSPVWIPFTDVARTHWAYPAVQFVYSNGLFQGTSSTRFSPNMEMTRGMFITVLYRYEGEPAVMADGGMSDVTNPARYYYTPIVWAHDNGIISGDSRGRFRPEDSITREDMAEILHKYAAFKGRSMSSSTTIFTAFPDHDRVSAYAVPAMRWAVTWEIIRGSYGRLLPLNFATRAEVAQIFVNYFDSMGR